MRVGIFRGGCFTRPQHAAVELHGYLSYILECAVQGVPYTSYGYKGKQVRDQIHAREVANLFLEFFEVRRCGEVRNLGGQRPNSLSVNETIDLLDQAGYKLNWKYEEKNRTGDHRCYISDLTKVRSHFPRWKLQYDLKNILQELVFSAEARQHSYGSRV